MLVAFEVGSPIRCIILFLFYPFITLLAEDFAFKAMVMVCFLGLKRERLSECKAFLPKFFLEDVGMESFRVLRRAKKTVAVSNLPRVMVECFLTDYLNVDLVVGRDLKLFHGYFLGVMEERGDLFIDDDLPRFSEVIGVVGSSKQSYFQHGLFSSCKVCTYIYIVSDQERRNWHRLPRNLYPRPLILHDGRLAFRPTFLATLAMLAWVPLGIALAIVRIVCFTFPAKIALSFLRFTGIQLRVSKSKAYSNSILKRKLHNKGILYVCNHKTLFDPIAIFYGIGTPLTAVTYGVSRMSEILANINTVRLTRDRDRDAELMRRVLSRGDLVVCPEGTTCRSPIC